MNYDHELGSIQSSLAAQAHQIAEIKKMVHEIREDFLRTKNQISAFKGAASATLAIIAALGGAISYVIAKIWEKVSLF